MGLSTNGRPITPASGSWAADMHASRKILRGHPFHRKTNAELRYICRDAGEAARCMRDHDPVAEGKYLDQIHDACSILATRYHYARGVTHA